MLHRAIFIILLLLLLPAIRAWSEPAIGLYEAEVEVENQAPEQRKQALSHALEQVLEKVARAHDAKPERREVERALAHAERYVQQYRYTEQGLWVRFDDRAVDGLLEQKQLPGTIPARQILLKVTGIRSLQDYLRVTGYLSSLELPSNTQPQQISPDSIVYRLQTRATETALLQEIVRNTPLQQTEGDPSLPTFHYSP